MVIVTIDDCYLNCLLLCGCKILLFYFYHDFYIYKLICFVFNSPPSPLKKILRSLCTYSILFQFNIIIIYSYYYSFDTQIVPSLTSGSPSELASVSFWCVLISLNPFSVAYPDTSGLYFPVPRVLAPFRTDLVLNPRSGH